MLCKRNIFYHRPNGKRKTHQFSTAFSYSSLVLSSASFSSPLCQYYILFSFFPTLAWLFIASEKKGRESTYKDAKAKKKEKKWKNIVDTSKVDAVIFVFLCCVVPYFCVFVRRQSVRVSKEKSSCTFQNIVCTWRCLARIQNLPIAHFNLYITSTGMIRKWFPAIRH